MVTFQFLNIYGNISLSNLEGIKSHTYTITHTGSEREKLVLGTLGQWLVYFAVGQIL